MMDRTVQPYVVRICDAEEKARIARTVLEALQDWFGVPESREAYIRESREQPFFAAVCDEKPVGFLCLKETGKATVELAVMGVLRDFHRRGMGRALFGAARGWAVEAGYAFMQVKTVRMGVYEDYDRTNLFYQSLGFRELEVFPGLWGPENPCQVYVMSLEGQAAEPGARTRKARPVIRFANEGDLDRVNVLRKQVNDLHVQGKPEVFKPGFCAELRDYVRVIFADPRQRIVVAEKDGVLCGFAVLNHITRPDNPFMFERDFLDIDEFCVDRDHRRQGVASAMIRFIREYAREQGFSRVELNMWEFNQDALAFYEKAGFKTFRRYMEMKP